MEPNPSGAPFVLVEGEGFEPSKAEPSDLQSDPFDRSGTPPNETEHYGDFLYLCQTVEVIICTAPRAGAAARQIRYHRAQSRIYHVPLLFRFARRPQPALRSHHRRLRKLPEIRR